MPPSLPLRWSIQVCVGVRERDMGPSSVAMRLHLTSGVELRYETRARTCAVVWPSMSVCLLPVFLVNTFFSHFFFLRLEKVRVRVRGRGKERACAYDDVRFGIDYLPARRALCALRVLRISCIGVHILYRY